MDASASIGGDVVSELQRKDATFRQSYCSAGQATETGFTF